MHDPIRMKFRWTADEYLRAQRYHYRHICRPVARWGLNLIALFALLFGAMMVTDEEGLTEPSIFWTGSFALFVGAYWLFLRPLARRWWMRRQFSKRPDRDEDYAWEVTDDGLNVRGELAASEMSWQSFTKVVHAPDGMLLYPNSQMFIWIPDHGFAGDDDIERFVDLTQRKIAKHCDVS